ncbi:MAG TPA: protein kinase, partial [Thermoanaerobaculia bacterium]|nr:protein kinase [Thermoanaerobaculia bacterium]
MPPTPNKIPVGSDQDERARLLAPFDGRILSPSRGRLDPGTEPEGKPGETIIPDRRPSPADGPTPPKKELQPRPLGEYLLLTRLGEDVLGTVYRALRSGEKDRFVRFRILESAELSPAAVARAVEENGKLAATLSHRAIVPHSQLGIAGRVPYMAWSEPTGWTLDAVLARVRAQESWIPLKYALSIAERVAAGLEAAWLTVMDGQPTPHGLLWPGFVSIADDTEVRVGGFGLADAVLPSLRKPRLAREIAPYVAPEARGEAKPGSNADVYSVGALMVELLTCRRPSPDSPLSELRSEDLPKEIDAFLRLSLASPAQRFPSVIAMRRVLQEALAASSEVASPADLALYFYTLLNPESRGPAFTEADSTQTVTAREASAPDQLAEGLGKRKGPQGRAKDPQAFFLTATRHEKQTAPMTEKPSDADGRKDALPERPRPRRHALQAALLAILGVSALFLGSRFLATPFSWLEAQEPPELAPVKTSDGGPGPAAVSLLESGGAKASPSKERAERTTAERESPDLSAKKPAEDSRFTAALARVAAERLETSEVGRELLARGRTVEQQGQRLLRQQHYRAA